MIKPWPEISRKPAGDFRIFTIHSEMRQSPRTGKTHDFYIIDCTNWVNVIALTPDDRMVMIEQFRLGSNTVELEVPGGMMDPHEDSPVVTGLRELREETGYEGDHSEIIGEIFPNPAIMNNTCYTLLVRNCVQRHPITLDHGEDIITKLVPVRDIPGLVASGRIRHSLVVVALYYFDLWEKSAQRDASSA